MPNLRAGGSAGQEGDVIARGGYFSWFPNPKEESAPVQCTRTVIQIITYHYSALGTRSLKTLDGEDNTMKGGVPGGENPYSHHSYCVPGPVVSTSHVPSR